METPENLQLREEITFLQTSFKTLMGQQAQLIDNVDKLLKVGLKQEIRITELEQLTAHLKNQLI